MLRDHLELLSIRSDRGTDRWVAYGYQSEPSRSSWQDGKQMLDSCLPWEIWCGCRTGEKKRDSHKLQQKFVGPYHVLEAYDNYTYKIERQGQSSVQNEVKLKVYNSCTAKPGKASASLKARDDPT